MKETIQVPVGFRVEPLTLTYLDPIRFEQCLRASGVLADAKASEELADAIHQQDCRNRAMETDSNPGATEIAFDRERYQACLEATAP